MTELWIEGAKGIFMPVLSNEITLYTEKWGAGVLKFTAVKEGSIDYKEGDRVWLTSGGRNMFMGYVFSKTRNKKGLISTVCYDQLRYLRNKDTYTYTYKRASDIVNMICDDYGLKKGTIENTGYVIPMRVEDNSTLFDIIYSALSLTKAYTGKSFVLYDDFGSINLRKSSSMVTNLVVNDRDSIDFNYDTTIDKGVYNSIKLIHKKDTKYTHTLNVYTAKDTGSIRDWGVLQYYAHIDEGTDGNAMAKGLLNMYKTKNRSLVIKTAGNLYIRAGSFVWVDLDIGDFKVNELMEVKTCKHIFADNNHIMEIEVMGGILNE